MKINLNSYFYIGDGRSQNEKNDFLPSIQELAEYAERTNLEHNSKLVIKEIKHWMAKSELEFEELVELTSLLEEDIKLIEVRDCSWRRCVLRIYHDSCWIAWDKYKTTITNAIKHAKEEGVEVFVYFDTKTQVQDRLLKSLGMSVLL